MSDQYFELQNLCISKYRGAQIPGAMLPWRLIFVGLQYVTLLACENLRWLLDFWKILASLLKCVSSLTDIQTQGSYAKDMNQ